MSEESETETGTILTSTGTTTSSFTIYGPGALSGKAIKRFGAAVVKRVDVIVYRLRLTQIESTLREGSDTMTNLNLKARKRLYLDLFELSRSVYSVSIQTRALRLIMRKVGEMDLKDITAAIVHLWSSERQDDLRGMLKEMLLCVRMYREPRLTVPNVLDALRHDESAELKPYHLDGLDAYHLAGLDAYGHGIFEFAQGVDISRAEFRAPFLKLLHLMVSLSNSPTISRVLLGLEILEFIIEASFQEAEPQYEDPGELLLQAILEKLNPIQDIDSISRIQGLIDQRVVMKSTVYDKVELKVGVQKLSMIKYILQLKDESGAVTTPNTQKLYNDLLEWSRFKYNVSIRTRAFHLIMRNIGRRDSKDLATAIVHLPSSLCRDLLWDMFCCIRMYRPMSDELELLRNDESAPLMSYYLAGLDAYGDEACGFSQQKVGVPTAVFRAPFLISLHSMVSLSTSPTFSRVLLGLEILEFIIEERINETSFRKIGPQYDDPGESLLQAILGKLDPIQDIHSISRIQDLIQELIDYRVAIQSTVHPEVEFKAVGIQRLSVIENILEQKESSAVTNPNFKTQKLCSDLLEWSRPGYSVLTRARAFRLIMHKIGRWDSEDLATAIVHLPSSECHNLLWDMFFCIQMYKETRLMPDVLQNTSASFSSLTAYYLAGLDAYSHEACGFPQQEVDVPRAVFRAPFLMSLRLMVMLSTSPIFSRVLLGLEILEFIFETSFQEVGSQYEVLGVSLLQVILGKLDPIQDFYYISQIQSLLDFRNVM